MSKIAIALSTALILSASGSCLLATTDCESDEDCELGRSCAADGSCVGFSDGGNGGTSGGGAGRAGGASGSLDWFTTPCSQLGGRTTTAGGCFIPCKTAATCPAGTLCPKGSSTWSTGQCEVPAAVATARGCGPRGWVKATAGCFLSCTGAGRDSECPTNFRCVSLSDGTGRFFCTGQAGSGNAGSGASSCGEPCSSGCCSTTGLTCCGPPFCSGTCAGSPCCR